MQYRYSRSGILFDPLQEIIQWNFANTRQHAEYCYLSACEGHWQIMQLVAELQVMVSGCACGMWDKVTGIMGLCEPT